MSTILGAGAVATLPGTERLLSARATPDVLPATGSRSVMERSLSRAGAVGNGKTDDTGAIQEAIAEVERNTRFETDASNSPFLGPGELVWPQGLFIISDTIRIRRSLRLRGEGQAEYSSGARIQQQQPGRDVFRVEPIAQGCSVGFSNLSLRANGGGGTGGALLRIVKAAGQCNSIRIVDMAFSTPQTHAIDITHGDDILVARCLFDASGSECIRMGLGSGGARVSNVRIADSCFYAIASECIVLGEADGVVIQGNTVSTDRATRTFVNVHGVANRTRNLVVRGNSVRSVDCLVDATAVQGLVIEGNVGEGLGAGVDPRRALITCAGACSGVVVSANRLAGEATQGCYDDTAGTVTNVVLTANAFTANGMRTQPLRVANTRGLIGDNEVSGAARNGVGYRWKTSSRAIAPGNIAPHASHTITLPIADTIPDDSIVVTPLDIDLPPGIVLTARCKSGVAAIRYDNVTGTPIALRAHDLALLVTR